MPDEDNGTSADAAVPGFMHQRLEKILGLGYEGLGFAVPADEVGRSLQIDWR